MRQAHFPECSPNPLGRANGNLLFPGKGARRIDNNLDRIIKFGSRPEFLKRRIPDAGGFIRANFHGHQVKSPVRNSAVNVHALVIVIAGIVIIHVCRLRIFPEKIIIVSHAGGLHGAQRFPKQGRPHDLVSDQPVRLSGILLQNVLGDRAAKHIREMLV